jgi:hypothetical protein
LTLAVAWYYDPATKAGHAPHMYAVCEAAVGADDDENEIDEKLFIEARALCDRMFADVRAKYENVNNNNNNVEESEVHRNLLAKKAESAIQIDSEKQGGKLQKLQK